MLLPDKHISLSESIVGFGSYILTKLADSITIDDLWSDFLKIRDTEHYPAHQSFDNLILAVLFLYSIGSIDINGEGELSLCA